MCLEFLAINSSYDNIFLATVALYFLYGIQAFGYIKHFENIIGSILISFKLTRAFIEISPTVCCSLEICFNTHLLAQPKVKELRCVS